MPVCPVTTLFDAVTTTDSLYVGGYASTTGGIWTQGTLHVGGAFTIDDSTLVTNLNADQLDSQTGTYYLNWDNFNNTPATSTILNLLAPRIFFIFFVVFTCFGNFNYIIVYG